MHHRLASLIAFISLSLNCVFSLAFANDQRVLLLNSYHPQYRWTAALVRGVQDELADSVLTENLHIEFMDGRRFVDEPDYLKSISQLLYKKYPKIKPDVIISSDDYSFNFLLDNHQSLFPDTPIVFAGVNVLAPGVLDGKKEFTGILEGMHIRGNLEMIRKIHPAIKRIVMLSDQTTFGRKMVQRANEVMSEWHFKDITLEVWDEFSLAELYQKASILKRDTVLLMLAVHKDRDGHYFSFARDLPDLSRASTVPIYGMWGALLIGNGITGGMMNNPYTHGRKVAKIAKRILNGEKPENIPISPKAEYKPYFDYHQLERFSVPLDHLPNESTIHFQPISFYQKNRIWIHLVAAVFFTLAAVIFVLTRNIIRRRNAEAELVSLNKELENKIKDRTLALVDANTQLQQLNKIIQVQAETDDLTNISNRRTGNVKLSKLCQRFGVSGEPLCIALFDIDHFKSFNDDFGHGKGDDVLVSVAEASTNSIRPSDIICRWGGEEFLIIFPNTEIDDAANIVERVRHAISRIHTGVDKQISASFGVANVWKGEDAHHLIGRADAALYSAKANGRNCMEVVNR